MAEHLGVRPGSASILCLMNDKDLSVRLVVDREVAEGAYICAHPCKNTSTLVIRTRDLFDKFLPATQHAPTLLTLTRDAHTSD